MPSPESSRRNLNTARIQGRVKFWRSWIESQRTKAELVWLHHTKPALSQRTIARVFHVSQPYVARLLKRVRLSPSIEEAIGPEAYGHYRECMEAERQAHFQAVGGPASLIGEAPVWARTKGQLYIPEPSPASTSSACEQPTVTEYVQIGRSTS